MNTNMSRERQEAVWAPAKQVAISRMEFMRLSALSGAAAALAATIPSTRIAEAQAPMRLFFKADYAEYFHEPRSTERWATSTKSLRLPEEEDHSGLAFAAGGLSQPRYAWPRGYRNAGRRSSRR